MSVKTRMQGPGPGAGHLSIAACPPPWEPFDAPFGALLNGLSGQQGLRESGIGAYLTRSAMLHRSSKL
jgi:hypothetical protein